MSRRKITREGDENRKLLPKVCVFLDTFTTPRNSRARKIFFLMFRVYLLRDLRCFYLHLFTRSLVSHFSSSIFARLDETYRIFITVCGSLDYFNSTFIILPLFLLYQFFTRPHSFDSSICSSPLLSPNIVYICIIFFFLSVWCFQ